MRRGPRYSFTAGRIDDAVGYAAAGQEAVTSGRFDQVRKEAEAAMCCPYGAIDPGRALG